MRLQSKWGLTASASSDVPAVVCPSPLLADVLMGRVASAELRDFRGFGSLSEGGDIEIHGVSPKRRDEFAAGRLCAIAALKSLGFRSIQVGREPGGAPIWPAGAVGSISHTNDIAAAVVAPSSLIRAIGLDIEQKGAVGPDLWPLLFTETERSHIRETDPRARDSVATALFAAKEAFYKAQWPITREWLDFLDVEISVNDVVFAVSPRSRKAWIRPLGESLSGSLATSGSAIAAIMVAPIT